MSQLHGMAHLQNDLVDIAGWPVLDDLELVAVLPSYAKARGLVWGTVTADWRWPAGPCRHFHLGENILRRLVVDFGAVWATSMGLWGLEEWKGWPLRGYLLGTRCGAGSGWGPAP